MILLWSYILTRKSQYCNLVTFLKNGIPNFLLIFLGIIGANLDTQDFDLEVISYLTNLKIVGPGQHAGVKS